MRRAILAALTASGLAALFAAPAEAVGTRYPFCIQGDEYPGLSNCTFTSYEQCQATASGRFLTCMPIPILSARASRRPPAIVHCPAACCRRRPATADTERRRPSAALAHIQRANVI